MSSPKVQPCTRGSNINNLNPKQRVFVKQILADPGMSYTKAARKAGYKSPPQAAMRLMKNKQIVAMLGKEQKAREDRVELTGDEVLKYLKNVLFFNPLEYFYPNKDGTWCITDLNALPEWVGQLIDSMKLKVVENKDGSTTSHFEVTIVSKSAALALAMRHVSVERHEHTMSIDWDSLYEQATEGVDLIEQRIASV